MTIGASQASTSATSLAYREEVNFGVVPTGVPRLLRITGESLTYSFSQESSTEINATRQVTDSVITDASATGGFEFKQQYAEFDPFISALLCSTFNTFGTGGVKVLTLTFASGPGTITGPTGAFVELVAGQWFSVKGSVNNDGFYRIGTVTGTVITVDAGTPLKDNETSTVDVSISSSRITNGTSPLRTFSFEKNFTDVGQFFMHRGRAISSMELSFAVGSILTGSFNTVGKDAVRANVTGFTAAPAASHAFGIISAVTGVGNVLVRTAAGANILDGAFINSMNITIDGALREQKAPGYLGAIGIGRSTFSMTGSLELYLRTGSVYDAALAGQTISISIPVVDSSGNGYAYTFANVKLGVPDVNSPAKDQDVMLSVPFTATAPNTVVDRMVIIDRFGVALT